MPVLSSVVKVYVPRALCGSWSGPSRDESLTVGALLENFIAITSIFVCVNPKLLRANGGCLGDQNR